MYSDDSHCMVHVSYRLGSNCRPEASTRRLAQSTNGLRPYVILSGILFSDHALLDRGHGNIGFGPVALVVDACHLLRCIRTDSTVTSHPCSLNRTDSRLLHGY